jgi:hypothetical protein
MVCKEGQGRRERKEVEEGRVEGEGRRDTRDK